MSFLVQEYTPGTTGTAVVQLDPVCDEVEVLSRYYVEGQYTAGLYEAYDADEAAEQFREENGERVYHVWHLVEVYS